MKRFIFLVLLASMPLLVAAEAADSDFNGRWRIDLERSSALDGWTNMDLMLEVKGSKVEIGHDMRWRSTRVTQSNMVSPGRTVKLKNFFRVEQRHMAVYPPKGGVSKVSAAWLDDGRALRVEAEVPVEVSQGDATIRIYSEYRLGEGGETLTVIELRSTRNNPLVYRFRKLPETDTSRP